MSDIKLPPLPEPAMRAAPSNGWPFPKVGYYTAEQMQEYAKAYAAKLADALEEAENLIEKYVPY